MVRQNGYIDPTGLFCGLSGLKSAVDFAQAMFEAALADFLFSQALAQASTVPMGGDPSLAIGTSVAAYFAALSDFSSIADVFKDMQSAINGNYWQSKSEVEAIGDMTEEVLLSDIEQALKGENGFPDISGTVTNTILEKAKNYSQGNNANGPSSNPLTSGCH